MELFSKKGHSENLGPRNIFPSPQTRRQISAYVYASVLESVRTIIKWTSIITAYYPKATSVNVLSLLSLPLLSSAITPLGQKSSHKRRLTKYTINEFPIFCISADVAYIHVRPFAYRPIREEKCTIDILKISALYSVILNLRDDWMYRKWPNLGESFMQPLLMRPACVTCRIDSLLQKSITCIYTVVCLQTYSVCLERILIGR